ncbi:lysocardiolipin acyltransferase 1-like [Salvelinus fontinalis]|uniref:lysocardiolipin acyltransferase 1-like n=1 Tax=Salvelinus fontinalis TaxID=8038 RepID=UPI0024859F52|nr:lysocardiolipin acyltransferase 1-like [Salvelinus fontinalis]
MEVEECMAVSVRGLYFVVTLFLGSFLGSILMLVPVLPLMLMSPAWYRWITNSIVATWLTLHVALLELVFGVMVVITGDGFIPEEHSVIIMNHRTHLEWMFLWCCLLRYSYLRLEKIYLKVGPQPQEEDHSHMENMLEYFCDIREPLQLLLFPEGTDLTDYTRARSDDFAEMNDLPKFEYVLQHRTTGFTFIMDSLRNGNNLDAIHDITVAYPKNIPQTERHLILGEFPREIHFHVRCCEASILPFRPAGLYLYIDDLGGRLSDLYAAEPLGFPQGVCRVPPCKTELHMALIKTSLFYWSSFITLLRRPLALGLI